ncbi:hypothetical protein JOE58_002944 [Curtobacterium luteum]|uniref:Uncharacterized protein n=2 Tax=Curtobacterium TaxID=2034 RepID=A0A8H9GAM4_9MICO|nr:hypothetical protein [Curtobacterium luteum]MBM7803693.1 hypothetical protein [Curtobacterium luteum]NUU51580.1 hypothetical protein [Curtobacterium luteum]GGL03264.1 hypothetical protein GCM10009769_21730 [Curtobacterium luteum]
MDGTVIVVDASTEADRYGWLVSSQYVSRLDRVYGWGAALSSFTPPPTFLLIGDPGSTSAAQVRSMVRISRTLGVRVVCDTSRTSGEQGGDVLARAIAAGATAWDGTPGAAGVVFTPA